MADEHDFRFAVKLSNSDPVSPGESAAAAVARAVGVAIALVLVMVQTLGFPLIRGNSQVFGMCMHDLAVNKDCEYES